MKKYIYSVHVNEESRLVGISKHESTSCPSNRKISSLYSKAKYAVRGYTTGEVSKRNATHIMNHGMVYALLNTPQENWETIPHWDIELPRKDLMAEIQELAVQYEEQGYKVVSNTSHEPRFRNGVGLPFTWSKSVNVGSLPMKTIHNKVAKMLVGSGLTATQIKDCQNRVFLSSQGIFRAEDGTISRESATNFKHWGDVYFFINFDLGYNILAID